MPQFNAYSIYYQSSPRYAWDARVVLTNDGAPVGVLMFMKDGPALPKNYAEGPWAMVHFPSSHLPCILDILRNERPLSLTLNANNGIATLSTGNEPVGELEEALQDDSNPTSPPQ